MRKPSRKTTLIATHSLTAFRVKQAKCPVLTAFSSNVRKVVGAVEKTHSVLQAVAARRTYLLISIGCTNFFISPSLSVALQRMRIVGPNVGLPLETQRRLAWAPEEIN